MLTLTLAALIAAADPPKEAPVVPPKQGRSETIKLFDGKSLDGWEGYEDYWSVKDGTIVGKNEKPVEVSTYLLTKQKFGDFHLAFQFKLAESEMHSGVAFWGRVGPEALPKDLHSKKVKHTYAGHLVMFPSGWGMYDLFGRNGLPVDPKPGRKVNKQHDWNDLEIWAQGNRVRVVANGELIVDWREPLPERIREAPIGLQLHSNKDPQEVQFKGLVLTTFPDDKRLEGKKVGDKVDPPK
jgi:3-keto-disaccharide hydrolase